MSGSTRSRQKRKLEPISLEELAGTTGMSGFCSFLTRDNSVAVPALDRLDESVSDASKTSAPETTAPSVHAVVTLESSAPDLSASNSGAPLLAAPQPHVQQPEDSSA